MAHTREHQLMHNGTLRRSTLDPIAHLLGASLIGLIVLPLVFGSLPDFVQAVVWLSAAVAVCAWLLVPASRLAATLATLTARLPCGGPASIVPRRRTVELARLMLAVGYLLLLQAI